MVNSIALRFGMYIIDHGPRKPIDFGECTSVFYWSTKNNSYTLQYIVSNYYEGAIA